MPKQKSAPKHASSKAKPKAKSAALREKELKRKKLLLLAAKAKADRAQGTKGKGRLPEDVDPEEQADELAASVEVDPDAAEDEVEEEPIADRKEVKDLLEVGRQKGFLTYDEVNDALPADIVSSDQIDDVMSMFGDNDIEIVDAQKAAQGTETKPTVAASEEQQAGPRGRGREGRGRRAGWQVQRPGAPLPAQDGQRSRCSPARARWRSPSASRRARRKSSALCSPAGWRWRKSSRSATS